ncbi:hypothetical protein ACFLSU_03460 [Bacteroidota bacterium]
MKKYIGFLLLICSIVACNTEQKQNKVVSVYKHEIVAQEVIQVSGYTYVRSDDNGKEIWVAVPSFKGKVGETYYFNDGLEMIDFKSKELNRVFKSIYFLQKIHTDPNPILKPMVKQLKDAYTPVSKNKNKSNKTLDVKQDLKLETIKGVTSVESLFEGLKSFKGKKVRVYGKVTKFNAMIMNKNWIHLQDGSDFEGEYDLTITSLQNFTLGDTVLLEGIVAVDKDFGYGYKYKLILEDAVAVEKQ